jgi:hypothetical protein
MILMAREAYDNTGASKAGDVLQYFLSLAMARLVADEISGILPHITSPSVRPGCCTGLRALLFAHHEWECCGALRLPGRAGLDYAGPYDIA